MKVSFVNITADPEQTMAYIARVSNPSNQGNENYAGLLIVLNINIGQFLSNHQ